MYSPVSYTGLTEDQVKHKFVPFLKDFYRNRYEPQPNSIQTSLDNVGEGGVVADGMMTFRKKDDTLFTCTYEATSRDKVKEVKYELNLSYFLWDCATFGAVCAAVLYLGFYAANRPWLFALGWPGNFGFMIGVGMIGFFCWYFFMNNWRKYRYIYAIEQFKRYAADEQWVAIADDVFPAPTDPYLIELKNQCVYNGFGLAIVPAEGGVRVLNAPSRLGVFGKDRRLMHWVTRAQWYQSISSGLGATAKIGDKAPGSLTILWNQISRPFQYLIVDPLKKYVWVVLSKPFGQTASAYTRFMSGQRVQKGIFFLALGLLAYFTIQVLTIKDEDIADIKTLQPWKGGANPEDEPGYTPSDESVPSSGISPGVPKQYATKIEQEVPTIDLSGKDEEDVPTINLTAEPDKPEPKSPKTFSESEKKPADNTTADACGQLQGKKGWIIQDNTFTTRTFAQNRVAELRHQGITGSYTALACIEPGKTGYIVWIGAIQSSAQTARAKASDYEKALERYGLGKKKLLLLSL